MKTLHLSLCLSLMFFSGILCQEEPSPTDDYVDPLQFVRDQREKDEIFRQQETQTEYPNGVNVIPGEAERDYPTFAKVEKSSFSCAGRPVGFYADPELRCQVWHICDVEQRQQSFLCTNGTIYNQAKRVCDWWYNVNCDPNEVNRHYERNKELYTDEEVHYVRNKEAAQKGSEQFITKPTPTKSSSELLFLQQQQREQNRKAQENHERNQNRNEPSRNYEREEEERRTPSATPTTIIISRGSAPPIIVRGPQGPPPERKQENQNQQPRRRPQDQENDEDFRPQQSSRPAQQQEIRPPQGNQGRNIPDNFRPSPQENFRNQQQGQFRPQQTEGFRPSPEENRAQQPETFRPVQPENFRPQQQSSHHRPETVRPPPQQRPENQRPPPPQQRPENQKSPPPQQRPENQRSPPPQQRPENQRPPPPQQRQESQRSSPPQQRPENQRPPPPQQRPENQRPPPPQQKPENYRPQHQQQPRPEGLRSQENLRPQPQNEPQKPTNSPPAPVPKLAKPSFSQDPNIVHQSKFRHSTPRKHNVKFAPSSRSSFDDNKERQVPEESQHPRYTYNINDFYQHKRVEIPPPRRVEVPVQTRSNSFSTPIDSNNEDLRQPQFNEDQPRRRIVTLPLSDGPTSKTIPIIPDQRNKQPSRPRPEVVRLQLNAGVGGQPSQDRQYQPQQQSVPNPIYDSVEQQSQSTRPTPPVVILVTKPAPSVENKKIQVTHKFVVVKAKPTPEPAEWSGKEIILNKNSEPIGSRVIKERFSQKKIVQHTTTQAPVSRRTYAPPADNSEEEELIRQQFLEGSFEYGVKKSAYRRSSS